MAAFQGVEAAELPPSVSRRSLFFVPKDVYDSELKDQLNVAPCNEIEVEAMKLALDDPRAAALTMENFSFGGNINCNGCGRQLNAYDRFEAGMKSHGREFLRWAILDEHLKVDVVPEPQTQKMVCSACGECVQQKGLYRGYSFGNYAYKE